MSALSRSGVVVLGQNAIRSLLPSTLISQVESLLEQHRINDAADLAQHQRKKLQGKASVDADEVNELRYVYQRIGFKCFLETRFDDAGNYLFDGELDSRVLVSYYPELRGSMFGVDDRVDMFTGVAENMPSESSVDDIISNYSPHLPPSTRLAPQTVELRRILEMAARDMLQRFLHKSRAKRRMEEVSTSLKRPDKAKGQALSQVEDTALAKLLAQATLPDELYALLQEPNNIVLSEIEPVLQQKGLYRALSIVYQQCGDDDKLLDLWSKIADGVLAGDGFPDPVASIIALLSERKDRALIQKWGVWLTKRDPDSGLKLLMFRDSNRRKEKPEEELLLVQQLQTANAVAAAQYLEYLVLQKRSMTRELHMMLAMKCVNDVIDSHSIESVSRLWKAKELSYASSRTGTPYLSYFASTTPDSEHKQRRLKAIIFLQGSTLYDPSIVRQRLMDDAKELTLELAIVEGKLGNHKSALTLLVHKLHDASSAEAYCTLGGQVLPPKITQSVAEKSGLQQWSSGLLPLPAPAAKSAPTALLISRQGSVKEELKADLLKILLEVYLTDEAFARERTAQLINSQAILLDVLDVIPLIPEHWPLNSLSSFLARSFRRTLHTTHEGQIIKSIAASQNLDVTDQAWARLRDYGAIIEEEDDDDGETEVDEKEADEAEFALSEKAMVGMQGNQVSLVTATVKR